MHNHSQTVIIYPNMPKLLRKTKNLIEKKKRKLKKKRLVIEVYEISLTISPTPNFLKKLGKKKKGTKKRRCKKKRD
jgi:hypothetical protein